MTLTVTWVGIVPCATFAQTDEPPARVARARAGPAGANVTLENIRLVVPPGAFDRDGFIALGVRGVPARPDAPDSAPGRTQLTVSTSRTPRLPLTLLITPSVADLAAAGGDRAALALQNTAGGGSFGCRSLAAGIACVIGGAGMFRLVPGPATMLAEPAPTVPGAGPGRSGAAVVAGLAAALLTCLLILTLMGQAGITYTRRRPR